MRGNGCFGFSYEQQAEIWIKWKNGDSLSDIGRALRKHPGSVPSVYKNVARSVGRLPSNDINIITNELFLETLNINVVGTWCLTRHAIPYLQKSGDGVIINITSCAGSDPGAVSSALPYAVAKSAINYLTKLLAKELGPSIRVNAVAPGLILTPRTEDFSLAIEKFENRIPLKRVGEPNDIAELVIAIIKSNYINGEIVVVDGGFSVL